MNNKGQFLVPFIILLPVFIFFFTLIVDLGLLYLEKRNINNNLSDALNYYLENKDNPDVLDKTKKLLNQNITDIKIEVEDSDSYITITVIKQHKSIYNIISKNDEITITYIGDKNNNKIIKG